MIDIPRNVVTLQAETKKSDTMATMTLQVPNSQLGWFEQMVRTMGWSFSKEETPEAGSIGQRVFEAEVDELLHLFNTDQISQEEVDRECELVREELYNARKVS